MVGALKQHNDIFHFVSVFFKTESKEWKPFDLPCKIRTDEPNLHLLSGYIEQIGSKEFRAISDP